MAFSFRTRLQEALYRGAYTLKGEGGLERRARTTGLRTPKLRTRNCAHEVVCLAHPPGTYKRCPARLRPSRAPLLLSLGASHEALSPHARTHFFGARGSLAPSSRSILAISPLFGIALPDSYSCTVFASQPSFCARSFCDIFFALRACMIAFLSSESTFVSALVGGGAAGRMSVWAEESAGAAGLWPQGPLEERVPTAARRRTLQLVRLILQLLVGLAGDLGHRRPRRGAWTARRRWSACRCRAAAASTGLAAEHDVGTPFLRGGAPPGEQRQVVRRLSSATWRRSERGAAHLAIHLSTGRHLLLQWW